MTASDSDALLHVEQTAPASAAGSLAVLSCSSIVPNPHQPRTVFDEEELMSLAESIRRHGVIQPVVVRPEGSGYVLVAGERRLRAAILAGSSEIPAIIRTVSEVDGWLQSLTENLDRANLNPVEEGEAYRELMQGLNLTQDALSSLLGVSRSRISQAVLIVRLPEDTKRKIAAGVLSFGHARVLCSIQDPYVIDELVKDVVRESLTVKQLEERVILGNLPGAEGRDARIKRTRNRPQHIAEVSRSLSDRLDTRVRVTQGRKKGQIVIDFAGESDLARILELLNP